MRCARCSSVLWRPMVPCVCAGFDDTVVALSRCTGFVGVRVVRIAEESVVVTEMLAQV